MGNSQPNVILPVIGNPNQPDPWKVTQNIAYCDLVTNIQTGQQAQSYTVPLDGRIKLSQQFQKYEYRRTQNENLVKVYRVYKRNSEYLCSGMDFMNVKTERIPWRLNQIRSLTLPEAIYTLRVCLVGYKRVRDLIGYVKVDGNMIGVTKDGEVRVWLNQNLAKNHPEMEYQFDPQIPEHEAEKQMIHYIIHTIKLQIEGQQFPPEIAQRLSPEKLKTFDTAIAVTKEIAQGLGLNLGQTRIDVRLTPSVQIHESKISNRQSLPSLPPIPSSSVMQQSPQIPVQISQVLQPGVSQLIQGQSQVQQASLIYNPSHVNPNQMNQSQVDQLNNSTIQLVRRSSNNSNLRTSGVLQNRQSLPIQIVINRASQIHASEPGVIQMVTPLFPEQLPELPVPISKNSQVIYQQHPGGLPPMNSGGRPGSKGKPPMPVMYNQPPPEVVPYQVVEAVHELRNRSKELRRSLSRQSNETATFVNVSRQQTVTQNQPPMYIQQPQVQVQVQGKTQPIGIRAQSPARNLSNSRVLVGPRIVGPPITQIPSRTQLIQQLPRVVQYNNIPPPPPHIQRPPPRVIPTTQRIPQQPPPQYLPIQYQKKQQSQQTIIERPTIMSIGGQERVVKKSVEKMHTGNPMTVINTQTVNGPGVVHLLRHHNRVDESFVERVALPNVPKPATGEVGRGIGVLNQKHNLGQY